MEALRENEKKFISIKKAKRLVIILIFVLFFDFFLFALPALASEPIENVEDNENIEVIIETTEITVKTEEEAIEEGFEYTVKWTGFHEITAYNSLAGQTDDTPCITANGFNLCEHGIEDSIAANFLYFGTKVRFPELFGDRIFIVRDRMNKRYTDRMDIWMLNKSDAKQFGLKIAKIEVLE